MTTETEKIDTKRLAELERKEQELADYYQASRFMRQMAVDMQTKAAEGSLFAQGWIAGQKDWAAFILRATGARQ